MRKLILLCGLFVSLFSQSQIHNRLIKLNVGFTSEQINFKNDIINFNDTSKHQFEFVSKSPAISYTHEFLFGNVFSLSGKVGFQYLNIFYDNQHYGSPLVYGSINPAVSVFYNGKFEYYVKLQFGVIHRFNTPDLLSGVTVRLFPENKPIFFAGVTIGGFNYYVSDKLGLNLELSIWSPELLTFGLSYRFFRGEIPTIQELQEL
ncbi:MAG: hypothetical protein GQ574_08655 [Crocinitomix sp.]|nr:hypothetical protein [Crocinitomix sp.]